MTLRGLDAERRFSLNEKSLSVLVVRCVKNRVKSGVQVLFSQRLNNVIEEAQSSGLTS